MKNLIKECDRITWTNGTGAAVKSGDPVLVGALLCVACLDIANGATGALATCGVFRLPKVAGSSGHAIAQGESVIFDVSAGKIDLGAATQATGDLSDFGAAATAALTTDTTVDVILCCKPGNVKA